MDDQKKLWESAMSTGTYFDCKSFYTNDLIERKNNKTLSDAALAGIGVMSGLHQGKHREGFFDIKQEGKNWEMLEIGCGYGLYAAHFSNYVKKYVGVDVSETIVNIGNKALNEAEINNAILYIVRDCDLSFIPNNSIDFIFTAAVFIHTPLDVTKTYIKETYKKLKPGGKFLHHFNMCAEENGFHGTMSHVFSENELKELFEDIPLQQKAHFDNVCYAKNQWMRYIYGIK